jgi:Na+/H+-dicarboxylate symporter
MNTRLVVFSGMITAIVGTILGLGVAEVAQPQYQSEIYQNAQQKYAIAGAVIGLSVGMGQECVRQLKQQQQEEQQ